MRLVKLGLFIAALLLVFGTLTYALQDDSSQNNTALLNQSVPSFTLTALKQSDLQLDQNVFHRKGYSLLNVWASWCGVCKQEHSFLLELKNRGIDIVGLNYRDVRKDALDILENDGDPYQEVIFDPNGNLALDLGVIGTPETFLVNKDGIIIKRISGVLDNNVWDENFASYFGS